MNMRMVTGGLSSSKQDLRLQIKERLQALPENSLASESAKVALHLTALLEQTSIRNLAAYWPMPLEVDVRSLLVDFSINTGRLWLPAVTGARTMVFRLLETEAPSARDKQGLLCPPATSSVATRQQLDMMLLPVRGFDEQGNRLGTGGGYYDCYLEGSIPSERPLLVGLAFHEQRLDSLPAQAHDVRLDAIVLPSDLLFFSEFSLQK